MLSRDFPTVIPSFLFKPGAHPQPAEGRLWARAWFTEIALRRMCLYVCMYICFSVCTHVSKALEAKSSLYTRNKGYTEPILNL